MWDLFISEQFFKRQSTGTCFSAAFQKHWATQGLRYNSIAFITLQEHLFRVTCARQCMSMSRREDQRRQRHAGSRWKAKDECRRNVLVKTATVIWSEPWCKSTRMDTLCAHARTRTHTNTQCSHCLNQTVEYRWGKMRWGGRVKTKSNHPWSQSVCRPLAPFPWPGAPPSLTQLSAIKPQSSTPPH